MGTMVYLEVLMALSGNPHGLVPQRTAGNVSDPPAGRYVEGPLATLG